jgi:hypothetical protein
MRRQKKKKVFHPIPVTMLLLLLLSFSCKPVDQNLKSPGHQPQLANIKDANQGVSIMEDFAPFKVEIMPLTEITISADGREGILKAYVSLIDSFDCQQKWPAVLRLELYKRVFRSADQKGERVNIWPDIDLTDAAKNNNHWKDFLRSYQFTLNFVPAEKPDYVLLVTCLLQDRKGATKRISAELPLKVKQTSGQ